MKSLKKSQAILFWCTSYLLLLILFITNIFIVFSLNTAVTNRINDKYCDIVLGGISKNAQEAVEKTGDIYSQIINFSNLNDIMNIKKANEYYGSVHTKELLDRLVLFSDENVNYYIYVPHTDAIISPGGIYTTQRYYSIFIREQGISYENWIKSHNENVNMDLSDKDGLKKIIFREKYTDSSGQILFFAAMYDEEFLLSIDELPDWVSECDIYLSDLKGNIFIGRQNGNTEFSVETAEEIGSHYGDEWEVFVKRIDAQIPCNITIAYPREAVWAELQWLKNMELVLSFVLLILCVIVIITAIKHNYAPLSAILKVLNISNSNREYDDIEKSVVELLSQNELYSRKIKQFDNIKTQTTLSRCLSKNYSPRYIEEVLQSNDITFKHKYFVVCAFDIFDISELFGKFQSQITNEEKYKDLNFIIGNIFSELFAEKGFRCDTVSVSDDILLVINTDDGECIENGLIDSILGVGINFIRENFDIALSYVVSELFEGTAHLSEAYNQCMYLLRYKDAMGIETPLKVSDVEKNSSVNLNLFLDAEIEQKLINCMASGNFEGAKILIDKIFLDISENKLSPEQLQCILINIGCVLCKIPQSNMSVDYETILKNSKETVRMYQFFMDTAAKICENFKPGIVNKADMMAEVAEYIEKNYSEVINLSIIANEFEISSNYLSVNFKQRMGISVVDYINKVRLDKAKKLLRDSSLTIKDIAVETGFGNMRTFNRIYQKYEGITPSAYRNSAL